MPIYINLFGWVKNLAWENEDGMNDAIVWVIKKIYTLYTQHYFMAPLATIGVIAIYLWIRYKFRKLYRENKALNLRLKRVEEEMMREDANH